MERLAKAMLLDAGFFATPGKTTFSRVPGDVGTSSYLAREKPSFLGSVWAANLPRIYHATTTAELEGFPYLRGRGRTA
jgi:hypothetical protein